MKSGYLIHSLFYHFCITVEYDTEHFTIALFHLALVETHNTVSDKFSYSRGNSSSRLLSCLKVKQKFPFMEKCNIVPKSSWLSCWCFVRKYHWKRLTFTPNRRESSFSMTWSRIYDATSNTVSTQFLVCLLEHRDRKLDGSHVFVHSLNKYLKR